jgi:hypothetical protein
MLAVFLERGPWGRPHARWPEAALAHVRVKSLNELPDAWAEHDPGVSTIAAVILSGRHRPATVRTIMMNRSLSIASAFFLSR